MVSGSKPLVFAGGLKLEWNTNMSTKRGPSVVQFYPTRISVQSVCQTGSESEWDPCPNIDKVLQML
jgi:hypothetical protein